MWHWRWQNSFPKLLQPQFRSPVAAADGRAGASGIAEDGDDVWVMAPSTHEQQPAAIRGIPVRG